MEKNYITWIDKNSELLEDGNASDIIVKAYIDLSDGKRDFESFLMVLRLLVEAGVTTVDCLDAWCKLLKRESDERKKFARTNSTGEARFNWMVDCLGIWEDAFDYDELHDYALQNHEKYGFDMKPLAKQYWWDNDQDYDLGWFNAKQFSRYQ